MKLITRDTDYAMRALCLIAGQKNDIVSVSWLVRELKIPRPFLRKILQILTKKGILKSYKGKGGGFVLNVPKEQIFLIDIIKAFQGPIGISQHIFKNKICPNMKNCKLKKKLDDIEKYIIFKLKDITLSSLSVRGERLQ